MITKSSPKISIITVVYNNAKYLEKTIKSVINQSYPNYEYIIIDGESTDGTVDVIKKYEEKINIFVSEPDDGIYDAMNKGILKSSGKYINFLNAGDIFHTDKTLEIVSKYLQKSMDFFCGKSVILYDDYEIHTLLTMKKLKHGVMPSHQASFVKRQILQKEGGFDMKYKSSADFDFFCRCFKSNYKVEFADIIVAHFLSGGFSSNKKVSYKETYEIIENYFGKWFGSLFYFKKVLLEQRLKNLLEFLGMKKVLKILVKLNNQKKVKW